MKRYIHALCAMLSIAICLTSCLKDDDTKVTYSDDMAISYFALSKVNRYITKKTTSGADTTIMLTISTGLPVFTIDQYKQKIYNTVPLPTGSDLKHILANITSKNSGTILLQSMVSDSLFYYSSTDSIDFSKPRTICIYAPDGSGFRAYEVTVNKQESEDEAIQWNEVTDTQEIPAALSQEFVLQKGEGNTFQLSKDGGITWTDETLGDDEDASLLPNGMMAWVSFPYAASENADYEIMAGSIDSDENACTVWRKIVEKDKGATPAKWVNIPTINSKQYYLPKMGILSLVWFNSGLYAIGNNGSVFKSRDGGITWKSSDEVTLPNDMESNNMKAATDEEGNLWLLDIDSGRLWKGFLGK